LSKSEPTAPAEQAYNIPERTPPSKAKQWHVGDLDSAVAKDGNQKAPSKAERPPSPNRDAVRSGSQPHGSDVTPHLTDQGRESSDRAGDLAPTRPSANMTSGAGQEDRQVTDQRLSQSPESARQSPTSDAEPAVTMGDNDTNPLETVDASATVQTATSTDDETDRERERLLIQYRQLLARYRNELASVSEQLRQARERLNRRAINTGLDVILDRRPLAVEDAKQPVEDVVRIEKLESEREQVRIRIRNAEDRVAELSSSGEPSPEALQDKDRPDANRAMRQATVTIGSWYALANNEKQKALRGFDRERRSGSERSVAEVGYALASGWAGELAVATQSFTYVLQTDVTALDAAPVTFKHGYIIDSLLDDYKEGLDNPARRAEACLMIATLYRIDGNDHFAGLYLQRARAAGADQRATANLAGLLGDESR